MNERAFACRKVNRDQLSFGGGAVEVVPGGGQAEDAVKADAADFDGFRGIAIDFNQVIFLKIMFGGHVERVLLVYDRVTAGFEVRGRNREFLAGNRDKVVECAG